MITVTALLIALLITFINFGLAYKLLYKIYNLLIGDHTFTCRAEKIGFYVHGWSAYIGLLVFLVFMPMLLITKGYWSGLMGTAFIIILRIVLKGKV